MGKRLDRVGSLVLFRQAVKIKENFKLKPAFFLLNMDLVSLLLS